MIKRKNAGISNLKDLDLNSITNGAGLKENNKEDKNNQSIGDELVKTQLRIPNKFYLSIKNGIKDHKITGSINSYVVEAVRRRLKDEGF